MEKTILWEERVQLPKASFGKIRIPQNKKSLNAQNAPVLSCEYRQIDVKNREKITGWKMTRILTGEKNSQTLLHRTRNPVLALQQLKGQLSIFH